MKYKKRKHGVRPEPVAKHQDLCQRYQQMFGSSDRLHVDCGLYCGTIEQLRTDLASVLPMDDVDWSVEEVNGKVTVFFRAREQ